MLFLLLKTMPGDPAKIMAGMGANNETIQAIKVKLGLHRPLYVQYWRFISGLFNGELRAITFQDTVWGVILARLSATLELGVLALALALFLAVPAGLLAAVYNNTPIDFGVTAVAIVGISIPVFWLALMLMIVFGVNLKILPVSGRGALIGNWSFLTVDGLRHLVIPVIALSVQQIAMNARLVRSNLLEVLGKEYIQTARAKGVREWVVILKHALRNALAPVLTNAGLQAAALFSGAVVTETVTAWPGIGRLMKQAILRRDQSVVFGLALFIAAAYMIFNLIVDLLYAFIDPRITYD